MDEKPDRPILSRGTLQAERDQILAALKEKAQQLQQFTALANEAEQQMLRAEGALAMIDKLMGTGPVKEPAQPVASDAT